MGAAIGLSITETTVNRSLAVLPILAQQYHFSVLIFHSSV